MDPFKTRNYWHHQSVDMTDPVMSFPEEQDIYKNVDVGPSLLLHHVSASSQAQT